MVLPAYVKDARKQFGRLAGKRLHVEGVDCCRLIHDGQGLDPRTNSGSLARAYSIGVPERVPYGQASGIGSLIREDRDRVSLVYRLAVDHPFPGDDFIQRLVGIEGSVRELNDIAFHDLVDDLEFELRHRWSIEVVEVRPGGVRGVFGGHYTVAERDGLPDQRRWNIDRRHYPLRRHELTRLPRVHINPARERAFALALASDHPRHRHKNGACQRSDGQAQVWGHPPV